MVGLIWAVSELDVALDDFSGDHGNRRPNAMFGSRVLTAAEKTI